MSPGTESLTSSKAKQGTAVIAGIVYCQHKYNRLDHSIFYKGKIDVSHPESFPHTPFKKKNGFFIFGNPPPPAPRLWSGICFLIY